MATLWELKQHLLSGGKIKRASWKNPSKYIRKCYSNCEDFINQNDAFIYIDFQDAVADDWENYEPYPYIGCLCRFWDCDKVQYSIGILTKVEAGTDYSYVNQRGMSWLHCEPLKPEEIKFYQGEQ